MDSVGSPSQATPPAARELHNDNDADAAASTTAEPPPTAATVATGTATATAVSTEDDDDWDTEELETHATSPASSATQGQTATGFANSDSASVWKSLVIAKSKSMADEAASAAATGKPTSHNGAAAVASTSAVTSESAGVVDDADADAADAATQHSTTDVESAPSMSSPSPAPKRLKVDKSQSLGSQSTTQHRGEFNLYVNHSHNSTRKRKRSTRTAHALRTTCPLALSTLVTRMSARRVALVQRSIVWFAGHRFSLLDQRHPCVNLHTSTRHFAPLRAQVTHLRWSVHALCCCTLRLGAPCVVSGGVRFRVAPLKAVKIPGSDRFRTA